MRVWRWLFLRLVKRWPEQRMWDLLDRTGIVIFVGPNGSGKSLAAVASRLAVLRGTAWECREATHAHHAAYREHQAGCGQCPPAPAVARTLRRDQVERFCEQGRAALESGAHGERVVYSTVVLLDDDGEEHERFRPLVDYRQLLTIEHADVLFDEVAGVSDSSDSGSIPVQVVQWLHTLRKSDVRLVVTTPAYGRCSKPIRQVAQMVVDCRSYISEPATSGRLWRPRQGFILKAYDAFSFEDFTTGTADRVKAQCVVALWRPGHEAERRYDTLGQVLMLGHVTESGMCSACGGQRSKPRCACPGDASGPLEVVEVVSASGSRTRKAVPVGSEAA